MKSTHLTVCLAAAMLTATATVRLRGADESAPSDSKSSPAELREKLKNMTPEGRRAAIQEWREKHPEAAPRMEDLQKRREEWPKLTPEEREAKIKERRAALENKVCELRKKKTNGTITGPESQQLERMERFLNAPPRRLPVIDGDKGGEPAAGTAKPAAGN